MYAQKPAAVSKYLNRHVKFVRECKEWFMSLIMAMIHTYHKRNEAKGYEAGKTRGEVDEHSGEEWDYSAGIPQLLDPSCFIMW